VLECVLGRRRDPAGDDAGRRQRRVTRESSFSCRLASGKHVRRRARGLKKDGISREDAEVFYRTESAENGGGACGLRREIPAAWGRNQKREKGKNGEGEVGVL
jgi:hypothetical protein